MNVFILTGDDSDQDIWDAILGVFDSVELAKASSGLTFEDGTEIPTDSRNWEVDGDGYSLVAPAFTAKYAVYNIHPHVVLSEKS
jgi:hypothetical protein